MWDCHTRVPPRVRLISSDQMKPSDKDNQILDLLTLDIIVRDIDVGLSHTMSVEVTR